MNKPSKERIEWAAEALAAFQRSRAGVKVLNAMEIEEIDPIGWERVCDEAVAVLTADDSHLAAEVERLTVEIKEMQMSFDVRWNADMRAIKMWQKEVGKELTWPDHADLVVWLLSREERVMKLLGEARIALEYQKAHSNGDSSRDYQTFLHLRDETLTKIRAELSGENRGGE